MKNFRSNSLVSVLGLFNAAGRILAAQNELARAIVQATVHNNVTPFTDTIADIGKAKADSPKGKVLDLLTLLAEECREAFKGEQDKAKREEIAKVRADSAALLLAQAMAKPVQTEEEKSKAKAEKESKAKAAALETAASEGWISPEEKVSLAVEWQAHPETVCLQRALDEALADVERQAGIIKGHVKQAAALREELSALKAENINLSGLLSRISESRTIKAVRDILAA
jgi:hypothetical protein